MADSNYLLELVLTARDEASSKIRALQAQVEELKAAAAGGNATQGLRKGLDDTADSAERAAEAHQALNREQDATRKTSAQSQSEVRRAGEQHDKTAESVATHAAAHDVLGDSAGASTEELERLRKEAAEVSEAMKKTSSETSELAEEQQKLAERSEKALTTFDELKGSLAKGSSDLRQLRQDFQATGQEMGSISRRFKFMSDDARGLRDAAEEAHTIAKRLLTLQSSSRQPLVDVTGIDKAKQDLGDLTRRFDQFRSSAQQAASEQDQAVNRLISKNFASRLSTVARQFDPGSADAIRAYSASLQASALAAPPPRPARPAPPTPAERGDEIVQRIQRLDAAARSGSATNAELRAGYTQAASGLRSLSKEFDIGSLEARKFASAMDEAAQKAKNVDLARASSGFGRLAQQVGQATDDIGIKIISLSAALRGIRLVSLVGLIQPLDTGLLSLAGSFISVASGAAQAGAAIGGVFLSGLGQLIPMVSVGIAGLIRLRDVFQAVQAAQAAKQQAFFQPNQGLITQLQNTSQLIQSEQSLTNAYYTLHDAQVQVRESQMALTQARIDAVRNITDLTLAERSAQLELRGSNLSLVQAQEEERAAQTSGDQQRIAQAQLAVQEAELRQRQSQIAVPRSAQNLRIALNYGIEGSPTVLGATEAQRQARLGVIQAQQGIAAAQRQMQITRLTLAQPASHESQQQATLKYLESQMSAPELALFNMLNRIETQLRSPNGPLKRITDYFIQPFLAAGTRLEQLLGDPKFLGPITRLARVMGAAMSAIERTMFGRRGTSFFETMAGDASKSIPIVTSAITGLMHVFEDIAKAAAPAFDRLSRDWSRFWNAMDARDRTPQGQARLTEFFNRGARWAEDFAHLAGSIFDLFKALGRDAAPQGMSTVKTFTDAIHQATIWVENHGPQVTRFFSQARQGLSVVGDVLLNIGKLMVGAFDLGSLKAFGALLDSIVLPAIHHIIDVIGFLVKGLMEVINLGFKPFGVEIRPFAALLEGVAVAFLGLLVVNRVIGAVTRLGTAFDVVKAAIVGFRTAEGGIFSKLGGAWSAGKDASKGLTVDATAMNTAADKIVTGAETTDKAADKMVTAADRMATAAGEQTSAATEQTAAATEQNVAANEEVVAGAERGVGGGGIVPIGRGPSAGTTAAEAGGAGVLSYAVPIAGAAAVADALGLFRATTGSRGQKDAGLSSLLGPIGGTHKGGPLGVTGALDALNPFGSHFAPLDVITGAQPTYANQGKETVDKLKQLQAGLKGISDPAQLGAQKLQALYQQAQRLLQTPDITATQRRGLVQLVEVLDPAQAKMRQAEAQWESTFQGISSTTGNVLQQVQQTLNTDISNISANLGSGTKAGAQALVGTIYDAWQTVLNNTSAAVRGTSAGLKEISGMLSRALKALGQAPLSQALTQSLAQTDPGVITGLLSGQLTSGGVASPHAAGGWHSSVPGGQIARVAEGGHDEVTLTTDPKHAMRQQALLARYLDRVAPHMAKGGLPRNASIYTSPFGSSVVNWGRTDQGVDVNLPVGAPIGAIGNAQVSGVIPNWYSGQPLIYYQLTDGPDAGRYVFLAEQISGVPGVGARDPQATSSLRSEVGQRLSRGQRLAYYATSGTGIETGWATSSGSTLAAATTGYTEGQVTPAGSSFRSFLSGLAHGVITGGAAVQNLIAPHVHGVAGAFGSIAQGAVNMATKAANRLLAQRGGMATSSGSVTLGQLAGGTIVTASDFGGPNDPSAYLRPTASGKIANSSLWGFAELSNPPSSLNFSALGHLPMGTPLDVDYHGRVAHRVPKVDVGAGGSGLNGHIRAVDLTYAVAQALGFPGLADVTVKKSMAIGGRLHSLRKSVRRLAEGGRAPWGGDPVPIIAHEGERIVNPSQWDEVGRLSGLGPHGLDTHLGYDTSMPRQHFASGGKPKHVSRAARTVADLSGFLTGIAGNLFTMDPGSLTGALHTIQRVFSRVSAGFAAIGRLGGSHTQSQLGLIDTLVNSLDNQTDGLLTQLATAFQRFQNNLSNWITRVSYTVQSINPLATARRTRRGVVGSGYGGVAFAGPNLNAGNIGQTGQSGIDALTLRSLDEQGAYLSGEQRTVQSAITTIRRNISRVKHARGISRSERKKAIADLESNYTDLVQQLETLQGAMNSNITSRIQQEQTVIQDNLSQVADVYQTQQGQIQSRQGIAQSRGDFNQSSRLDVQLSKSFTDQAAALQPALRQAEKIHDPNLVAQIKQQIAQLQASAVQAGVQALTDAQSAIDQAAQSRGAFIQAHQTVAQAFGRLGELPGIDRAIAASAQKQIDGLTPLLAQATKAGDTGLATQLQGEIAGLIGTVAQNLAQSLADTRAVVEEQFQSRQLGLQSKQSIAQSMGRLSELPGIDDALISSAQDQIASLTSILDAAKAQGNQGLAVQLQQEIDGLNSSVVQLAAQKIQDQIGVIQQAAQTQQSRVSELQTVSQVMQSQASTVSQFAAASAVGDQALTLNQSNLQGQLSGYNNLLVQAIAQGNVGAVASITQTIDQLTGALAQNAAAIEDNTAQLVQQTSQYLQSRSQFTTGLYGGLGQIIQTIGQTTGFTNVAALRGLTGANNNTLQSTNVGLLGQLAQLGGGASGIASMLQGVTDPAQFVSLLSGVNIPGVESGQTATWISTFESVISSLETNTGAIATNNQQLAQLNGQLLQPQSWASMTWTSFRSAVFSGMGNLLPQYQASLSGSAIPTIAPSFGSPMHGQTAPSPTIGQLNITHPVQVLDPQILGQQLHHELSTTP